MDNPVRAIIASVDEDLLPLSTLLHQKGVRHRIFEDSGQQVLEVMREEQVAEVRELYRAWRAGEVNIQLFRNKAPLPSMKTAGRGSWRRAPVTMTLICLSVLGFALVYLTDLSAMVRALTYRPIGVRGGELVFLDIGVEYWRLVTPAFLHFSWLHIAFNSLWLWELGTRAEQVVGRFNMFMLFLVIAVVSNASQDWFGGPGLFGGMSGVVYGMLGFTWVAPMLQPRWQMQPSHALVAFMVGWLLLCASGIVEQLGMGAIANAAHFGGLVCGAVLGTIFGALSRFGGDKGDHGPV